MSAHIRILRKASPRSRQFQRKPSIAQAWAQSREAFRPCKLSPPVDVIHKNSRSAVPLLNYRTGMISETFALPSSLTTLKTD